MSAMDLSPFNQILARLEGVADRLEQGLGAAPSAGATQATSAPAATGGDPAIATSFDVFTKDRVAAIEAAVKDLGVKEVEEATTVFLTSIKFMRQIMVGSGHCKKPKDTDWQAILGPVLELGGKAQKACDNRSDYFQNQKAMAEAMNIVTFMTVASPPMHVQNVLETMDFHAIKVMQKKNEKETIWIKAVKALVKDFKDWCAENCKLGLDWNFQGQEAAAYFAANPLGVSAAAPAAGAPKGKGKGAPPIPKGGFAAKPKDPEGATTTSVNTGAGMADIFAAINTYSTSGLKKVTDDMKTKNRPKDDVPPPSAPKATPQQNSQPSVRKGKGPRGPPSMRLENELKWVIENYDGDSTIVLEQAEKHHLVNVINCNKSTLQIKCKVKSIAIDGCERTNVICQDVISTVELVNCERSQVQTTGVVRSFAIDKCNGVNIYLPKESLDADIVTSKSSEMNVTIPEEGGEEGDTVEIPIPEQFVTKIVGKKLSTEVSDLYK